MASPRVLDPVVRRPATREVRVVRSPSQPFSLLVRPWTIQPTGILPVLPGETMTSCLLQGQFWTAPLKPILKNTPWTWEYFLFYVKFRDLPGWEESVDGLGADLIDMIETGESLAAGAAGAYAPITGTAKGGQQYVLEALKRITECYFREEGQAWNAGVDSDNMPVAHAFSGARRDALERLAIGGVGTNPTAEDRRIAMPTHIGGMVTQAYMDYAANRNQTTAELQAMDYEDIVRSAGGKAVVRHEDREDLHVPELLGYIRHFDYPTNTVEPTTGVPATAFGHRVKQSLKQNFRFPEFGWLIPIMIWRPKALYQNQLGTFASMMDVRTDWFMASDDPNSDAHFKNFLDSAGPLSGIMDTPGTNYGIDLRNLLWHGEQFTNFNLATAGVDMFVSLPGVTGNRDYPAIVDTDGVFVTAGARIWMNGVLDCSIKTYQVVNPYLTQDDRQLANRD